MCECVFAHACVQVWLCDRNNMYVRERQRRELFIAQAQKSLGCIIMEIIVSPMERQFYIVTFAFLGTGTIMDILKHVGTADWDRERLNMSVNTPDSWSAHALRTRFRMPSGPAVLQGLTRLTFYGCRGSIE